MFTPISTGHISRPCRTCNTPFVGLGTLCPVHLAQHARNRASQIQTARFHSAQILAARELPAKLAFYKRSELFDALDCS